MPDLGEALAHCAALLARPREPRNAANASASEVRSRILEILGREGGIPLSKLRVSLGVGWGTLYHHVAWLQEAQLVQAVQVGKRRMIALADPHGPRGDPALLIARARLQAPTARRIAETIAGGRASSVRDVVLETAVSERTVRYHVRLLVDAGLVSSASPGRHDKLRATPLLLETLRAMPSAPQPSSDASASRSGLNRA